MTEKKEEAKTKSSSKIVEKKDGKKSENLK